MTLAEQLREITTILIAEAAPVTARTCADAADLLDRLARWRSEDGYAALTEIIKEARKQR